MQISREWWRLKTTRIVFNWIPVFASSNKVCPDEAKCMKWQKWESRIINAHMISISPGNSVSLLCTHVIFQSGQNTCIIHLDVYRLFWCFPFWKWSNTAFVQDGLMRLLSWFIVSQINKYSVVLWRNYFIILCYYLGNHIQEISNILAGNIRWPNLLWTINLHYTRKSKHMNSRKSMQYFRLIKMRTIFSDHLTKFHCIIKMSFVTSFV